MQARNPTIPFDLSRHTASGSQNRTPVWPRLTPEARHYAVKELARRAGVSGQFFRQWAIAVGRDSTTVSFGNGSNKTIRFVHGSADPPAISPDGAIPVTHALWPQGFQHAADEPDLILPFCFSAADSCEPIFSSERDRELIFRQDLLSSLVFTLSRTEETISAARDEHGRFPASASLASRYDFLERPILDELGLVLRQGLSRLLPGWKPELRPLRVKITHDIDDVGLPFKLRTALGHGLRRRRPGAALVDLLSSIVPIEPTELGLVRRLAEISISRGFRSAFYWKASPMGPCDSGYDPMDGKVQRVVDLLHQNGFELGVHPGYETFGNRQKLITEIDRLRHVLRTESPGGRQHYLRWLPDTWFDWEACGLSYDSSVGFADRFGFRAGTAFPYRPWSFRDNRELRLIELPLILMDCSPVKYMKLGRDEGLARIRALVRRIERTGGVFTLLWHNTPLMDSDYRGWLEGVLDTLAGAKNFEVPPDAEQLW